MSSMNVYFSGFINRVKFKRMKKYEQYGITFAITYFITILFTMLIVLNYYEDIMVDKQYTEGIWSFINAAEDIFTFGYCTNLDAWTYLVAKIVETLIPTTLTFSGTILILQTTKEKNTSLNAWLFIALCCFAMVAMFFMVSRLRSTLSFYMWLLFCLFCIVFLFSAKLFNMQNEESVVHKKEESDGKIAG